MIKILIIDDEISFCDVLTDELNDMGYETYFAYSGTTSIEKINKLPQLDLILTDILLGDIEGWSVAKIARSKFPNIKIIYMTGYSQNSDQMLDNSILLKKPYGFDKLIQSIEQLTKN